MAVKTNHLHAFHLPSFTCTTRSGKGTGCLILNVQFIIYTAKKVHTKEALLRPAMCQAWPQKTSLAPPSKAKGNKLFKSLGTHPPAAGVYVGHGVAVEPGAGARLASTAWGQHCGWGSFPSLLLPASSVHAMVPLCAPPPDPNHGENVLPWAFLISGEVKAARGK